MIKVMSLCKITFQHIQKLLGAFFQHKNVKFNGEQEKRMQYLYKDGTEKSFPQDQHLSSLGKPGDAKR